MAYIGRSDYSISPNNIFYCIYILNEVNKNFHKSSADR